jgi:hypothetical protein
VQSTAIWAVRFTTDNKGLLIRIDQSRQCDKSYANATLAPDWDIVEAIVSTLQLLPVTPSFSHVKGHQDDHIAYEDLPLDAQLNIEAEALAGKFQTKFPSDHLQAPLLPSTGVNLMIDKSTVTGQYPSRIHEAAASPELIGYLRRRNYWTKYDWSTIDLPVYQQISARNSHQHVMQYADFEEAQEEAIPGSFPQGNQT